MSRRPRPVFRSMLVSLAVLALVAAGCGDDGDDNGASSDAAGAAGAGARADWPDKLVFGAVPSEESTALQESYDPIVKVLEAELEVEIDFTQATDYAGIIEGMIAGNVDIGVFGPFSYIIARGEDDSIEPVGAFIDEPGAEPGYQSYGITSETSDVASIEDFEGKKVCFVDPASTSGYLYPTAGLLEAGIDPDTDIEPTFAGGHDASGIAVANGDCEVGFAFDEMVDTILVEEGQIPEDALKVVWKSETIPGSPMAVRGGLPASLVEEVKRIVVEHANADYLLEQDFCEGECRLTDEGVWGFAAVDDGLYDGVRAVCATTEAETCKTG